MRKTLLAVLTAAALFAACKKDDNKTATPKDNLTGSWLRVGDSTYVTVGGTRASIDNYAQLKDCEKDDLYTYNSDGSAVRDESTNKCRSTDPQTVALGSWSLISSDSKLVVGSDTSDIVELTSSRMTLSKSYTEGTSSKINRRTFNKK